MLRPEQTKLEVWGDPIAHSRSPDLHRAAYGVLGFDWSYGRRRVGEQAFADELDPLDGAYRALSLTMPLKGVAFEAARTRDRHAQLTGAVNTLLLDRDDGPRGSNTDVGGIVRALRERGTDGVESARIVGAGATATSALVALSDLGAQRVQVIARRPQAIAPLVALGEFLGVVVAAASFDERSFDAVPVTIATLPGDAAVDAAAAAAMADAGGLLFDAVYGNWPTALASAWEATGATTMSGLWMLLHQAVLQIRLFTSEDAEKPLPDETDVVAAMRAALED